MTKSNGERVPPRFIELGVPPAVLASMLPVFVTLSRRIGKRPAWYAGLAIYWGIWCGVVPLALVGRGGLKEMFRPARFDLLAAVLASVPPLVSLFGGSAVGGAGPRRESLALALTAFGNGLGEEVLWRGMYATGRRSDLWTSVVWPSLWFGAWHIAPGSAAAYASRVPKLVAGAFVLGLAYATVASRTGSIRWTVASHVLTGLGLVASTLLRRARETTARSARGPTASSDLAAVGRSGPAGSRGRRNLESKSQQRLD